MEQKHIIAFDFKREDRIYRLEMPAGCPLGEAYEATASFLSEMVRMINEHAEKSMPKDPKAESLPTEDVIVEEA
jgi:hypothetical protein